MPDVETHYGIAVSQRDAAAVRDTLELAMANAQTDAHLLETIYALAYQLMSLQRFAQARRYLLLLAVWAPTNTGYLRALARAQKVLGQADEALNTYAMCVSLGDASPEVGLGIAECHLSCNRRANAALVLHEATEVCGNLPEHGALRDRIKAIGKLLATSELP